MAAYYGNLAGPGPSYFRVVIEMSSWNDGETNTEVFLRRYVQVADGSAFGGTILNTSWDGQVRLYGAGTYADTGWVSLGRYGYGADVGWDINANYTGYTSGYHQSSVAAHYYPPAPTWTPNAPSGGSSSRSGDYGAVVKWSNNPTAPRPYSGIVVQRSANGGSYATVAQLGGSATSFTDSGLSVGSTYAYRVAATNGAGWSGYLGCGSVYVAPYQPYAPSGGSLVRNSDSKASMSWSNNATATRPYSGITVQRSVNGGSWATVANLGVVSSYSDTTTSADNSYAYRIAASNATAQSGWFELGTVYMTPAAPAAISVARSGETNVSISLTNDSKMATALVLERSTDRSNWAVVSTTSGLVRSASDNPGGGTFYYRAKNTRGDLHSGYVYSDAVVTITPPSQPTLRTPSQSAIVNIADQAVALTWVHNPIDGSSQRSAEVQLSLDGGATWSTVTVGDEQRLVVDMSAYKVNDGITWRVRTKGAADGYGPYSSTRSFKIAQVPTFSIVSPTGSIHFMPLDIVIDYSDPSGTLSSMSAIIKKDGAAVYERTFKGASASIAAGDFLPDDGATYEIEITATSTTGFSAYGVGQFAVEYDVPVPAGLVIEVDDETTFVSVTATTPYAYDEFEDDYLVINGENSYFDDGDVVVIDGLEFVDDVADFDTINYADTDRLEIYRIVDGKRVLIGEGNGDTASAFDRYAPLNTDYAYESIAYSEIGSTSSLERESHIKASFSAIVENDEVTQIKYNPSYSMNVSLPDKKRVYAWGREYPVSFTSDNVGDVRDIKGTVLDIAHVHRLNAMMRRGGRAVLKDYFGDVIHADFDSMTSSVVNGRPSAWDVSMTANHIDGEVL